MIYYMNVQHHQGSSHQTQPSSLDNFAFDEYSFLDTLVTIDCPSEAQKVSDNNITTRDSNGNTSFSSGSDTVDFGDGVHDGNNSSNEEEKSYIKDNNLTIEPSSFISSNGKRVMPSLLQEIYVCISFSDNIASIEMYKLLAPAKVRNAMIATRSLVLESRPTYNEIKTCLISFGTRPPNLVLQSVIQFHDLLKILMTFYHDSFIHLPEMLQAYPQFETIVPIEQTYLLNFLQAMKLALKVIPGKNFKGFLLDCCAKVEGSGRQYKTGGGPTRHTRNRIAIYEHESGIHRARRAIEMEESVKESSVKTEKKRKFQTLSLQNTPSIVPSINYGHQGLSPTNSVDSTTSFSFN
eukprot:gene10465-14056_t